MSPAPATSYIDDTKIDLQGDITVDWDVYTMATFDATIVKPKALDGFDEISIERNEIEIFGGRVETYSPVFSSSGRYMRVTGFDNTVRLRDYKTPIQTITGETTEDALTAILSETPFAIDVDGDFSYITELKSWDTFIELATELELFTNLTIELAIDNPPEIETEVDAGDYFLSTFGVNCSFAYRGTTKRWYIFSKDNADDLFYHHSTDGVTWTTVDTTANMGAGINYNVMWDGTNIFLLYLAGDGDIDCWEGSINDADGVITWNNQYDGVVTDVILEGMIKDDQGDLWFLGVANGGTAYESTDTGATWNSRFDATNDMGAGFEVWGLADVDNDGDIMAIVFDSANTDLEQWLWDRSLGTVAFVRKIDDEVDVDASMQTCQDADYNVYFGYSDAQVVKYAFYDVATTTWTLQTIEDVTGATLKGITAGCDGRNYYVTITSSTNDIRVYKIYGTTIGSYLTISTYGAPTYIHMQRGFRQIGAENSGEALFLCLTPTVAGDDLNSIMLSQEGVRLIEGQIAGVVRTDPVTKSGAAVLWGLCSSAGNDDLDGYTLWNILRAAGDAELIDDQAPNFDMNEVGVPVTDQDIHVYIELDGTTGDPVIFFFDVSERTDAVSLETDGEDGYTGVLKLAELSGGEFWVTDDGDGTYTVHFSTRRGEDKSAWITLKCATTTDEPDTKANVKVLSTTYDYTDFANAVLFIGGTNSDGVRVMAEMRDSVSIAIRGQEYWITVRDAEVTTFAMAQTRALLELYRRNSVTLRIRGEFVDKLSSNSITIGDSVTLIGEWSDGDLKIDGDYRIVTLTRTWGVGGGERVVAEFSNRMKPAQYYNYLQKIDSLERVSTS